MLGNLHYPMSIARYGGRHNEGLCVDLALPLTESLTTCEIKSKKPGRVVDLHIISKINVHRGPKCTQS